MFSNLASLAKSFAFLRKLYLAFQKNKLLVSIGKRNVLTPLRDRSEIKYMLSITNGGERTIIINSVSFLPNSRKTSAYKGNHPMVIISDAWPKEIMPNQVELLDMSGILLSYHNLKLHPMKRVWVTDSLQREWDIGRKDRRQLNKYLADDLEANE